MPFIDSLRPEQYQRRQRKQLECLTGIVNNADDILVFGCGDRIEEAEKDHDMYGQFAPDRVRAFVDTNSPQDVKGIQRILGICNYLSRFTPNLAEIVKPLTELTHVNVVWSWSAKHDIVFDTAKSVISNATTLWLFDVNKPCVWMPVTRALVETCYKMAS